MAQDSVLNVLELGDVVFVNLGVRSGVAEGCYHLIRSVMQPQDVGVRLVIRPLVSITHNLTRLLITYSGKGFLEYSAPTGGVEFVTAY